MNLLDTVVGRPGNSPAGTADTVITRLRARQAMPGRKVFRRQLRNAGAVRARHRARRAVSLKGQYVAPTTTRVNPDRDHRSRKSGRLRKELR